MADGTTQNNPGGTTYTVVNPNNTSDLFGGQQQCNSNQDFWKALTAMKAGTGHVPCIQAFHDTIAYLGWMMTHRSGFAGFDDVFLANLMPAMVKEAGENDSEIRQTHSEEVWNSITENMTTDDHNTAVISGTGTYFFPFKSILPSHMYRSHSGAGNVNVSVMFPNTSFSSVRAANAPTVKANIGTVVQNLLAFSPMMDTLSGSDDSLMRDINADGSVDYVGNEYNQHLIFCLLRTFFNGFKTSTGTPGAVVSYSVNPFGMSLVAGSSFENREDGIRRFLGRENGANGYGKFNLDEFLADSLFTTSLFSTKMERYQSYVASLSGSAGRTKFTDDARVAASYFSMPIVVPVAINWSGGYVR